MIVDTSGLLAELKENRLALNETTFRSLNERIACNEADLDRDGRHDFVCECSTSGCFERITLTLEEYESVREDGTHFLLAPGHEDIEIEQVVARNDGYIVVEKDGAAGIVALDEDPRA